MHLHRYILMETRPLDDLESVWLQLRAACGQLTMCAGNQRTIGFGRAVMSAFDVP
jgi:hypothetical protein